MECEGKVPFGRTCECSASDSSSEVTSRLDAGGCLHLTAVDCEIVVVNSVKVVVRGKVQVFFKARDLELPGETFTPVWRCLLNL